MAAPPDRARELDELTLARARRGDEAACRTLVTTYQRPIFALLSRLVGGSGVEDLAQETFLRAFRALPDFDPGGPARLSTWLLTIASRLALDELRRRLPVTLPLDEALPAAGATDDDAERRRLAAALQQAIAALPPVFRAAFVLYELHDLSYEEIARSLDVDVGTVKSRLARARAALREALAEVHDG